MPRKLYTDPVQAATKLALVALDGLTEEEADARIQTAAAELKPPRRRHHTRPQPNTSAPLDDFA